MQELKDFQRDGHSLEELWKVAKGDTKYQDFAKGSIPKKQDSQPAPAASVPEDLVCHLLTPAGTSSHAHLMRHCYTCTLVGVSS